MVLVSGSEDGGRRACHQDTLEVRGMEKQGSEQVKREVQGWTPTSRCLKDIVVGMQQRPVGSEWDRSQGHWS